MKFLVGYKLEDNDYITVVNVDSEDKDEVERELERKYWWLNVEMKSCIKVKKKWFEKSKRYLIKFRYDHIQDIQLEIVYAKNMIEAIDPLIVDPYDHGAWRDAVAGLEKEPEGGARCRKCFAFNLNRTAQAAKKCPFATTLTVSPHKSSAAVFQAGSRWDNFEPIDFKKKNGFLIGRNFAARMGFYRQNYCGCEFSRGPDRDPDRESSIPSK